MRRAFRYAAWLAAGLPGIALAALALFLLASERGTGADRADCALVFGSAAYGFDVPGPAMLRRVSTAVRLYHEDRVRLLVLSGGRVDSGDQSEAEVMRRYALRQSVPDGAMRTEERATSTWQNLAYARPLLEDCDSAVAVSDAYHLGRIRLFAFMQGWGSLATYPADGVLPARLHVRSVLREVAAATYYLLTVPFIGDPQAQES